MLRPPLALVGAALLYLALRLAILLTNFDGVASPPFELYPMGTMAELFLRGVEFPVRYYYDNAAGQLVFGHAAIPFYALLGSTYFALKAMTMTLGLGALVLLWLLLDRHHSRRAAVVGAYLWALSLPLLTRYSITCSGNHFENLFFLLLSTLLFFELHRRGANFARLAAAGFGAALSIFVFMGALIPVGILAGLHLGLRGWRASLRDLPGLLAGFAVGLAPLLALNFATSGRILGFFATRFNAAEGGQPSNLPKEPFLERLSFYADRAPHAAQVQPSWLEPQPAGMVVALVVLALWAWGAWDSFRELPRLVRGVFRARPADEPWCSKWFQRCQLLPWTLYLPLFVVAFGISNFKLGDFAGTQEVSGYRYFLPTATMAIVLAAVLCDRWWTRGGFARVAGCVPAGVLCAAGSTSLAWVDASGAEFGNGLRYEGYNFAQMARGFVSGRNAVPREEIEGHLRAYPADVRTPVLRGLGFNYGLIAARAARKAEGPAWRLDLDALCAPWPAEWRAELAHGAGTSLRWSLRMAGDAGGLDRELRRLRSDDPELARRARAGAATTSAGPLIGPDARATLAENAQLLDAPLDGREDFARGVGFMAGKLHERGVRREVELAEALRAGLRPLDPESKTDARIEAFEAGWAAGVDEARAFRGHGTQR